MDREIKLLASSLAIVFGALVMVFAADLHGRYQYGQAYQTALRISPHPGLVMLIGGGIAIVGAIGILTLVIGPKNKR